MPYKNKDRQLEYQRSWMTNRRAQWFEGKSCRSCASTDRLELNHIDPSKKIDHRIWSWSDKRRLAELEKCEPLCHWCHKEVTRTQKTKPTVHGVYYSYKKGCRCALCVKANSVYRKSLKERNATLAQSG